MRLDFGYYCTMYNCIIISYSRSDKKVVLAPCCVSPKTLDEPIAYDMMYFVSNFNKCIDTYIEFIYNKNLNDYYFGYCMSRTPYTTKLCNRYCKRVIDAVSICVTNGCNLKCVMCKTEHNIDPNESYIYKKILNSDLSRFKCVSLTTYGEPFIYKVETFNHLENYNGYTTLITNATLLNDDDILQLSKYKDKLFITVSVDSIHKDTYEKIRVGANFDKVIHNVRLLNDYDLLDRVSYVRQKLNEYESLDDIKNYFNFTKVDLKYDQHDKDYYINENTN